MPSKRTKAVKKLLRLTGDKIFIQCHWCPKICVLWQKLPKESILSPIYKPTGEFKFAKGMIKFVMDGQTLKYPIATTEHIVPLSEGGTNADINLTIACHECNSTRCTPPNLRSSSSVITCIQCQTNKTPDTKRRCTSCLAKNKEEVLRLKNILRSPERSI